MIPCTRVLSVPSFMKERGKMSLQQKLIQLPLVGMILLCLLALVYLLAWKRFSKRDPSATIIKHSVDTSPDDALKYWTVANMRAATDADQQDSNASDLTQKINASLGKAAQQEGQPPRNGNSSYPLSTVGKVFFTNAVGQDMVCSGTAVASLNQSVVDTAGH